MQTTGIFIIAHAPLASALKTVAEHVYPDCGSALAHLDIFPADDLASCTSKALQMMRAHSINDWLILTDVFGATPCNIARGILNELPPLRLRMVAGVNVPMLWRLLCYRHESLDSLAEKALNGGTQGIMSIESMTIHQQASKANHHDQSYRQNQQ